MSSMPSRRWRSRTVRTRAPQVVVSRCSQRSRQKCPTFPVCLCVPRLLIRAIGSYRNLSSSKRRDRKQAIKKQAIKKRAIKNPPFRAVDLHSIASNALFVKVMQANAVLDNENRVFTQAFSNWIFNESDVHQKAKQSARQSWFVLCRPVERLPVCVTENH